LTQICSEKGSGDVPEDYEHFIIDEEDSNLKL
jgi:hypothetical protein